MILRKIFFSAAMLLLIFASVPRAFAEDANRVKTLQVSVWPEYDKPAVLVLIQGTLADTTNLPREVSVLVPATATGVIATFETASGSLAAEQAFKSEKQDGFNKITYIVGSANYHVEYYDDLVKGTPDKKFEFAFKSPAPADQVTLEVQQPLKATNFVVTPADGKSRSDGTFNYFTLEYANVTAGQALTAQVQYTKTDPNPSYQPQSPATAPAATTPATATSSSWTNIYMIAALVVLGGVAVIGFFMLQRRSRQAAPAYSGSRKSRRDARRAGGVSVFCTQCGRSLGSADNFCPKCGARRGAV